MIPTGFAMIPTEFAMIQWRKVDAFIVARSMAIVQQVDKGNYSEACGMLKCEELGADISASIAANVFTSLGPIPLARLKAQIEASTKLMHIFARRKMLRELRNAK